MPPELMVSDRYQLYVTEEVRRDVGFVVASLNLGVSLMSAACEDVRETGAALKSAVGEICYEVAYSLSVLGTKISNSLSR